MTEFTIKLAQTLINSTQETASDGLGCGFGADEDQLNAADPKRRFRQALVEREDAARFLAMFPQFRLDGLEVLDFGCGYGGKTVEFAKTAKCVVGVEPIARHIDLATQYAAWLGVANAQFKLCAQATIPCDDAAFDLVVSHDVIEHVENPEVSLGEIHRVLRPGGRALIVFPPYWGAKSHHLDYVTRFPGLHWLFAPETLVDAINRLPRDDVPQQPPPRPGWAHRGKTLPTLNGLSGPEFHAIVGDRFVIEQIRPVLLGSGGSSLLAKVTHVLVSRPMAVLGGLPRDMVTASIVAVLRKPAA